MKAEWEKIENYSLYRFRLTDTVELEVWEVSDGTWKWEWDTGTGCCGESDSKEAAQSAAIAAVRAQCLEILEELP